MGAARKSFYLASASLGAIVAAGLSATPAAAACNLYDTEGTPTRVVCAGEFQQSLNYDAGTLTLTTPSGGTQTQTTDLSGDNVINLRGDLTGNTDVLAVSSGAPAEPGLSLAGGNDRVRISEASIDGTIGGGTGDDTFRVISTDALGSGIAFSGDEGNDQVFVEGGSIGGFRGGVGDDSLSFTGGTITGPISEFEQVNIKQDPDDELIGNSGPLVIDGTSATTLNITNVRAPEIAGTVGLDDFDGIDDSPAPLGLDLSGISSLRSINSGISIFALESGVDTLELRRSVMRLSGRYDLTEGGRDGQLVALNSTIDAGNGVTTDELRVNSLRVKNTNFIIDATSEQGVPSADRLFVLSGSGTQTSTIRGNNRLTINFADGFSGSRTGIVVAEAAGASSRDILRALATFEVVGGENAGGAAFSLARNGNTLVVVEGVNQGVSATTSAATGGIATASDEAVGEIVDNLIEGGGERVQVSDTFGVFASGQFGHTWHNGLDVNSNGQTSDTADFDIDAFSAFVTGEVDVGEELGLEEVGVRFAAFGGYVQSDVTLDREIAAGIRSEFEGSGYNRGGMLGASVSFDRVFGQGHYAYAGTTVAGFLGTTDVTSADSGATGDYGTQGVVVSNKFGIAFAIADRVRLDTRFGIGYTHFHGDDFTGSDGVRVGDSRTSYATLSFEPGVQTSVQIGSARIAPSARLLLEFRPGYVNDASVEGTDFDFDEAKYSIGGEIGASARFSESLTAGAFISAKGNDDLTSVLGRLAVNYRF